MPLALLTSAVLAAIELAINNVLKLDESSQQKLTSIDGSVFAINCTSPAIEIFLIIRGQTLNLCSYYEGEVDTRISGEATALFKLLLARDKNRSFYNDQLEVKGNLERLQTLQKILMGLDIDWEYQLSKFIGDIPTQAFSDSIDSAKDLAKNTHSSLIMDIDEYIHEEKKLFPANEEMESFYSGIGQLKLRIDRLNARLNKLPNLGSE